MIAPAPGPTAPPRTRHPRTFESLGLPNFRRYYVGLGLSMIGTWGRSLAVVILVLHLTDSGVAAGAATAAQWGPLLVLGPWAGVLCDRVDRHRLLVAINAIGLALATAFAAMVFAGVTSLWAIYPATLAAGIVSAIENPARRTFISDLVEPSLLQNAVSLTTIMLTAANALATALAGLLISGPGIEWCFALNALTFVPQIWLLGRIDRTRLRQSQPTPRARGQLLDGLRYVATTRELREPLLLLAVLSTSIYNAHPVLVPLLATRELGGGSPTYTAIFLALSAGSLLGGLGSARRPPMDTTSLATALIVAGGLDIAFGLAPVTAVACAAAAATGYWATLAFAGINSWVQLRARPALAGRVVALVSTVSIGTSAVAGFAAGAAADALGTRAALALAGALCAAAGAGTWLSTRARVGSVRCEPSVEGA